MSNSLKPEWNANKVVSGKIIVTKKKRNVNAHRKLLTISWVTEAAKSIQSNILPDNSRAATAVELENAEAPFLTPRKILPSRLYASTGALNSSTNPDTKY